MMLSMLKKLIGALGKVMIRTGSHLLLLSHKNLASLPQGNIVSGCRRVSQKRKNMRGLLGYEKYAQNRQNGP